MVLNPSPDSSYIYNDLRVRIDPANEDQAATRTADSIEYQLSQIENLAPGTYTAYFEVRPSSGTGGHAYINFQIGTADVEDEITALRGVVECAVIGTNGNSVGWVAHGRDPDSRPGNPE